MDLKELNAKVEELGRRTKERYHYARSKGFSSREALFLQHRPKETIDRIAQEKAKQ